MFQVIEEHTLNHWQSLQTVLYDGWILRFADGYTKRANSVNPIYQSKLLTDEKIAECERLYSNQNLPTVFKITPTIFPNDLDSILEYKGYAIVEPSLVKTLDLSNLKEPVLKNIRIDNKVGTEWIDIHTKMSNKTDATKMTLTKIISNILVPKAFITLYDGNEAVSCGFGVIENGYVGIYNLVTDVKHRNKGYGEQLLLHLLNWAKANGAVRSYLQVVANNHSANRLYSKLGYEEIYTYWYRVKQTHIGGS
jgi:hypothetical protein